MPQNLVEAKVEGKRTLILKVFHRPTLQPWSLPASNQNVIEEGALFYARKVQAQNLQIGRSWSIICKERIVAITKENLTSSKATALAFSKDLVKRWAQSFPSTEPERKNECNGFHVKARPDLANNAMMGPAEFRSGRSTENRNKEKCAGDTLAMSKGSDMPKLHTCTKESPMCHKRLNISNSRERPK